MALRLSFGLSLLLVGVSHYMTLDMFVSMTADGLGPLAFLGQIWAYVLPALMIVGGALLAIGMFEGLGAWAAGIALGSIPVGVLLKPVLGGVSLGDVMPLAVNAFLWLLVYAIVVGSCNVGLGDSPS